MRIGGGWNWICDSLQVFGISIVEFSCSCTKMWSLQWAILYSIPVWTIWYSMPNWVILYSVPNWVILYSMPSWVILYSMLRFHNTVFSTPGRGDRVHSFQNVYTSFGAKSGPFLVSTAGCFPRVKRLGAWSWCWPPSKADIKACSCTSTPPCGCMALSVFFVHVR